MKGMKIMNDVMLATNRDKIFTMFNSVLIRDKDILKRSNDFFTELLNELWEETSDKWKVECLFSKSFRERMDYWGVTYKEDLIRLEIPETLEDE